MSAASNPSNADATATALAVIETRVWIERVVIGLNLCPFARAAHARGRTRYVGCAATDVDALLETFANEVRLLRETPARDLETTLLVHPFVLNDFADYNDFLDVLDGALEALGATGVLQVASFHPHYRFAGSAVDDVTNATNRSPHPLLQLLREDSVEQAVTGRADSAAIYEANISTLQRLGWDGWQALQDECRAAVAASDIGSDRSD
jgi:hypothetical protein